MRELALFAGAGGGLLATQALGIKTVCAVENNQYCQELLIARQKDNTLHGPFDLYGDICKFNGNDWRNEVDIITGGFPCQAFSTAARGRNNAVNLWPEMLRVISESVPTYIFAENVSAKAIEQAASDCASLGYKTEMLSLSAKDLGADHARERFWLLAYTDDKSQLRSTINAKMGLCKEFCGSLWQTKPNKSGMVNGMARRMERYRAIGNGQVPVVAASALWTLANFN